MSSLSRHPLLAFIFAVLALLSMTGCSDQSYVYPDEEAVVPAGTIEMSPVAPPVPSDEVKPEISDPRTHVWRQGHWSYEDQRFYWIPGEILTLPSPTAVWSPDRWEHREYGWVFIHGYWQ